MATCPECGTIYQRHIQICPRDGTVLDDEPGTDWLVGRTLDGKYRIDTRVGEGGMGAVFRATHLMLGKVIALKLIKPELVTSKDIARRFQREARAASALSHPGIATVHDLGQTEDGMLYIAMEFVEGPTLKFVLGSGPLPSIRIIRILRQVVDALGVAHERQIVHRDLKPQNIVLRRGPGGRETATLLDFGIAKTFDGDATQLTSTGIAVGTPQYMSPEQASGSAADPRSDLYSVGVILYEMLTGEVPFVAPNPLALLLKHVQEVPLPPSQRRPDLRIPPALEAVALRCLEKKAEHRYQTAGELLAALEECVLEETRRSVPVEAAMLLPPPVDPPRTAPLRVVELLGDAPPEAPSPVATKDDEAGVQDVTRDLTPRLATTPQPPIDPAFDAAALTPSATMVAGALNPSAEDHDIPSGTTATHDGMRSVSSVGNMIEDAAPQQSARRPRVLLLAAAGVLIAALLFAGDWLSTSTPDSVVAGIEPQPQSSGPDQPGMKTYTIMAPTGRWTVPVRQTERGEFVSLDRLMPIFGLSVVADPNAELTIRAGDMTVQFSTREAVALASNRLWPIPSPPQREGGTWWMPIEVIPRVLAYAMNVRMEFRPESSLIIVVDDWRTRPTTSRSPS
jgi:serine/threonine protein kinase